MKRAPWEHSSLASLVASGKPKRKHCSKRISQEQEEKENSKKSRPFKQMPPRRAPVFLLSPGINTRGTTLPPRWIYFVSRGLVSTNQTFFASETLPNIVGAAHAHYAWFTKTYGLYPSHNAPQVPTLLGVVASVCTPLPTRTQQLPTFLAQQCWELLHPFAHHCQHARNNSQHCCALLRPFAHSLTKKTAIDK